LGFNAAEREIKCALVVGAEHSQGLQIGMIEIHVFFLQMEQVLPF
jgi:hypothetical protein